MAEQSKRNFFSRTVLPVALFCLVVGGIAFVTQNMPKWRTNPKPPEMIPNHPNSEPKNLVRFLWNGPIWDPRDPSYAKEMEKGVSGHIDFPFENASSQVLRMKLMESSCDCSKTQFLLVSPEEWNQAVEELKKGGPDTVIKENPVWKWTEFKKGDDKGFQLPENGMGIIRFSWNGRKDPGSRLKLTNQIYFGVEKEPSKNQTIKLEIPILIVQPLEVIQDRVDLGNLGPGDVRQAEYYAWSSTREKVKILFAEKDPLLDITVIPVDMNNLKVYEEQFRKDKKNTRLRSAYRISVKVLESNGKDQMESGRFIRTITPQLEDYPLTQTLQISGTVKGEIEIGAIEDRGAVRLGTFSGKRGTKKSVFLWVDSKSKIQISSHKPSYFQVKLTKSIKDSTPAKSKWVLEVEIPPNTIAGSLPEDSAIFLSKTGSPRLTRIPITGNGES